MTSLIILSNKFCLQTSKGRQFISRHYTNKFEKKFFFCPTLRVKQKEVKLMGKKLIFIKLILIVLQLINNFFCLQVITEK